MRGAWVEIPCTQISPLLDGCRSPCGERGLKWTVVECKQNARKCRSPCGERGLKLHVDIHASGILESLPVRGAWVEMLPQLIAMLVSVVAPRAGSVG